MDGSGRIMFPEESVSIFKLGEHKALFPVGMVLE